jgi:cytochrome c oxidase subunit II
LIVRATERGSVTLLAFALVAGAGAGLVRGDDDASGWRVVPVVAQRYRYAPAEIEVKRGEHVRLEFQSVDFLHGFKVPDLGIRADLPPGRVTRVEFVADRTGTFDFLCDNFCGSGHEEMTGRIVVR